VPVLASKHFNIIEETLKQKPLLTTTKITSVTHVLTTASCQTVENTVSNNLNPKSKLAIHATMFIITFLIIVGGWIGKSIVANNEDTKKTVSWALGSIWFLLAVIVGSIAATNKYNKKEDFVKTVLVTRYLLFDLSALMVIFNWDVVNKWWKLSLIEKITQPFKDSNIANTLIKLIGSLVGVGMIIYLFVI
jgi:VanZ family protein